MNEEAPGTRRSWRRDGERSRNRFAVRTGFDPRGPATPYRWFRVLPPHIEAWREENELAGRELMRHGRWLV